MRKIIYINGRFMEDRMHGLVRYSRELLSAMDDYIADDSEFILLIPPTSHDVPNYKKIKVKQIGKKGGIFWEQTSLRKYIKREKKSFCLNLSNVAPLFIQPGVTAILDIMYKVNPSHYTKIRNRISRIWHCLQYSYLTRHEKRIITISEFCKKEIEKNYPKSIGKIEVIPCAWQHVRYFKESIDWKKRYPFLKEKEYFFSLATLSKNKNGKWIIEVAKRNPDSIFAVGGKYYETEYSEIPSNVHMLGYISDEDVCSLMKHCKAFIFPSLYEGFGLPPLEALALGTEVIASNRASLPEVLGKSVHYINPLKYDINIERLLEQKVDNKEKCLMRYSWNNSAIALLKVLNRY